nr:DUF3107 domain-containing protein [Motilibacter aurantiacus]
MPSSHTEGVVVEVKVGVQQAPRELVIESKQSGEEVAAAVSDALANGGVLTLVDERGRRLVVPVEKLAYVEIGEPEVRRVGFGAI